jgi:hypothetical protein
VPLGSRILVPLGSRVFIASRKSRFSASRTEVAFLLHLGSRISVAPRLGSRISVPHGSRISVAFGGHISVPHGKAAFPLHLGGRISVPCFRRPIAASSATALGLGGHPLWGIRKLPLFSGSRCVHRYRYWRRGQHCPSPAALPPGTRGVRRQNARPVYPVPGYCLD